MPPRLDASSFDQTSLRSGWMNFNRCLPSFVERFSLVSHVKKKRKKRGGERERSVCFVSRFCKEIKDKVGCLDGCWSREVSLVNDDFIHRRRRRISLGLVIVV